MTKCAVVSCRGEYMGGTVNGSAAGLALCDAHSADWLRLYRRLVTRPAPGRDVWPPCGPLRVMADWLRLADAELRNGGQAVVAGAFDASGNFTGVVVDAAKEAK